MVGVRSAHMGTSPCLAKIPCMRMTHLKKKLEERSDDNVIKTYRTLYGTVQRQSEEIRAPHTYRTLPYSPGTVPYRTSFQNCSNIISCITLCTSNTYSIFVSIKKIHTYVHHNIHMYFFHLKNTAMIL